MAFKRSYIISETFPNQIINPENLQETVKSSEISKNITHINIEGDTCDIWFDEELPDSDSTSLDLIVSEHDGILIIEDDFGSEPRDGSSDGLSSTTSTSYQQKLKLNAENLPAGKYVIFWSFEFSS